VLLIYSHFVRQALKACRRCHVSWPHRLARPRTLDFHSSNRGSNPLGVKYETLAQLVEHLTFNERVDGSSPSSLIVLST
jgi:hypothetical protein